MHEIETTVEQPFVSVIIPVFNDPDGIRQCLNSLTNQTYPEDRFEIIVVDNDSTDHTPGVVQEFDVTMCVESGIQGSYAARNTGIEAADGEIIGFTDADCTPSSLWIEAGVSALAEADADMAAGRIRFDFSDEPTSAERFDALMNMRNDKSINKGVAKTANLFVRRRVFDQIGSFPDYLISGGDVFWTRKATNAGFELVFAPRAVVRHPSRQLGELLRKQYRVGIGQIQIWRLDNRSAGAILLLGLFQFPMKVFRFIVGNTHSSFDNPNDANLREIPSDRNVREGPMVYTVAGMCMLAMTIGRIVGFLRTRKYYSALIT